MQLVLWQAYYITYGTNHKKDQPTENVLHSSYKSIYLKKQQLLKLFFQLSIYLEKEILFWNHILKMDFKGHNTLRNVRLLPNY